jgi:aminomethyltransferase
MPIPSLFHSRTEKACTSLLWKEWSGYHAARSYGFCHDQEYVALRHSAGLIDVSPLFKYDISGPDAARFLARITVRDITKLAVGRVTYLCWCDDDGKVIDDGTVARLDRDHYRLTAAEPSLAWLQEFAAPYEIEIEDRSERLGALALQGPKARDILRPIIDFNLDDMRYFDLRRCGLDGLEVWLSRTGYTGDLGYEIWIEGDTAEETYDAVLESGAPYGMLPVGLDAMDVARLEAGYIMNGVDYFSAHQCLVDHQKATPWGLGLGWTVDLDRQPFIGQSALRRDRDRGPDKRLVGLISDWDEIESLFDRYGLPPQIDSGAWRDGRPVYDRHGQWIGQATSGTWSPILKKSLALAQVRTPMARLGTRLELEITIEYRRHTVGATVVETPFFDPPRKRA